MPGMAPIATLGLDEGAALKLLTIGKGAAHDDGVATDAVLDVVVGGQRNVCGDTFLLIRLGVVYQHVVRAADKAAALVVNAVCAEAGLGLALLQVEGAGEILGLATEVEADKQVAEGLVAAELVLPGGGAIAIVSAVSGLVETAGPKADLIEVDAVKLITAEHGATYAAVAHGERLALPREFCLCTGFARQVGSITERHNGVIHNGRLLIPKHLRRI